MAKKRVVSRSSHVDPDKVGKRKAAGTRRVYRGTVEAHWSCTSCGRSGIPGRRKRCPSCGNPKGGDETYEAPSERGNYLTAKELKAMGVDPQQHLSDETCQYCGAKLKPGTQRCPNCGAPLTDVGYTTHVCPSCGRESNAEQCPNCGAPTEEKLVAHRHGTPPPTRPKPPEKQSNPLLKNLKFIIPAGVGLLLLCALACLMVFLMYPRHEVATVEALSWERQIAIQEHQHNRHEGWELPPGADVERREERVHHHDQVLQGYEESCGYEETCETISVYDHTETTCYDDGTCDEHDVYRDERECTEEYVCKDEPVYEDVPVYRTWYTYRVWEWVDLEPAVARGTDPATMHWPDVRLTDDQRQGERTERCTVTFRSEKGGQYNYTPPCTELERFHIGSPWRIERRINTVVEVEPAG